jgi:hypothetical protein
MIIGGRYGIAVVGTVFVGLYSVSAAMKVAAVDPKEAKAATRVQVDTKTAQTDDDKKQANAKRDEDKMFQRTVLLYRAIFACDVKKVSRLLKRPVYIDGVRTLWWWSKGRQYYLSPTAVRDHRIMAWELVTTPLNLAVNCALTRYRADDSETKLKREYRDYYQIIKVLVQQKGVSTNIFMNYQSAEGEELITLPLHLAMLERAWPIVSLLLSCGANPDWLDNSGKTAYSDRGRVQEYSRWKAARSKKRS